MKKNLLSSLLLFLIILSACSNNSSLNGTNQVVEIKENSIQIKDVEGSMILEDDVDRMSKSINDIKSGIISKYEIPKNVIVETVLNTYENAIIISDEESAVKIAEAVMKAKFGESVENKKPLIAIYDEEYDIWLVKGTLVKEAYVEYNIRLIAGTIEKGPSKERLVGGVPYVIINKNTGQVLAVWHTK